MKRVLLTVLLVAAAHAQAADIYRLATTIRDSFGFREEAVILTVDGALWRYERDGEPSHTQPHDVLIGTADGIVALDLDRRAWFVPDYPIPFHRLRAWDIPISDGEAQVRRIETTTLPVESETLDGSDVERHAVRVVYRIRRNLHGTRVDADVTAIVTLWIAPAVDAELPDPLDLRRLATGIPRVDAELASALAAIPGFVMKREIGITRTIAGGSPSVESASVTVRAVERGRDAARALFAVPQGWPEEPPVIGVPGGGITP